MQTFDELVEELSLIENKKEKGDWWEELCIWYFKNSPIQKNIVEDIWPWDEWPDKPDGIDLGTDLILKKKNGEICGIQCKGYNKNASLSLNDISKWLADTSNTDIYQDRLLMSTTVSISANVKTQISRQKNIARYMLFYDFKNENLLWPKYGHPVKKLKKIKPPPKRNYQIKAVNKVINGFEHQKKGKLTMACGTGKTLTAFWIDEKLNTDLTICLFPSLLLLKETMHDWAKYSKNSINILPVCSDESVTKKKKIDEYSVLTNSFPIKATTNTQEIVKFLQLHEKKVIFGTYNSSLKISKALLKTKTNPDLLIADEAHRTAGINKSEYSICLDDIKFPCKNKLFMTATERDISGYLEKQTEDFKESSFSMDNEKIYGKKFFDYSFGEAIDNGHLAKYKIHILEVEKKEIISIFNKNDLLELETKKYKDVLVATTIAVTKAINSFKFNKFITFHNRLSRAEQFEKNFYKISKSLKFSKKTTFSDFLSSNKPTSERSASLEKLEKLMPNELGFISNARCLSEGVDVPSLDGIVVSDPKHSKLDIVQMVGRALRKKEGEKKTARILIPFIVDKSKSDIQQIEESSFKTVNEVISAMRTHDDALNDLINNFVLKSTSESSLVDLKDYISIENSSKFNPKLLNEILIKALKSREDDWELSLQKYLKFVEKYERFPKGKGGSNPVKDERIIERWVRGQRENKKILSKKRIETLNKLEEQGMWIWSKTRRFDEVLPLLQNYLIKNNHVIVPLTEDKIGRFVEKQRITYNQGEENDHEGRTYYEDGRARRILTINDIRSLNNLHWTWTWNINDFKWEFYYSLLAFIHKNEKGSIYKNKIPILKGISLPVPLNLPWSPSTTGKLQISTWSKKQIENFEITTGKKELTEYDKKKGVTRFITDEKIEKLRQINFDFEKVNDDYLVLDEKYNNLYVDGEYVLDQKDKKLLKDGKYTRGQLKINWKFK